MSGSRLLTVLGKRTAAAPVVPVSSLLTGLAEYWAFDEAEGNRVGEQNGTVLVPTDVTANTGKVYATAAEFLLANNASMAKAAPHAFDFGDTDFTIAFWIYPISWPTSPAYRGVLATGSGQPTGGYSLKTAYNNALAFQMFNVAQGVGTIHAALNASAGIWNWCGFQHDAANNTIGSWSGGGAVSTVAWANACTPSGDDLAVGGLTGTSDHRLGPLAIWTRLLTAEERARLYNDYLGLAYPFSAGAWWEAGYTIPYANCLEHGRDVWAFDDFNASYGIAGGQPWTLVARTTNQTADSAEHLLFDTQTGRFSIGYSSANANGFRIGVTWSDISLFAEGDHTYILVCDGSALQAYRDGVAVGAPVACALGIDGTTHWTSLYSNGNFSPWAPALGRHAGYDVALSAAQITALHASMMAAAY